MEEPQNAHDTTHGVDVIDHHIRLDECLAVAEIRKAGIPAEREEFWIHFKRCANGVNLVKQRNCGGFAN